MLKSVRADTVLRALGLSPCFKIDRFLNRTVDYSECEVIVKQKAETCGKLQKVSRIEYNLTPNGIEKLAAMSKKQCSIKVINDFTSTVLTPIPVVYLFVVASDDLGITVPDGCVLVKYGFTNNLARRMNEHVKTYGPAIFLKYHSYVDPIYLKDAENDVRNLFKSTGWHVENSRYTELAIIPNVLMPTVLGEYRRVGEHYMQKVTSLSVANESLRRELEFAKALLAEKDRVIQLAMTFVPSTAGRAPPLCEAHKSTAARATPLCEAHRNVKISS